MFSFISLTRAATPRRRGCQTGTPARDPAGSLTNQGIAAKYSLHPLPRSGGERTVAELFQQFATHLLTCVYAQQPGNSWTGTVPAAGANHWRHSISLISLFFLVPLGVKSHKVTLQTRLLSKRLTAGTNTATPGCSWYCNSWSTA